MYIVKSPSGKLYRVTGYQFENTYKKQGYVKIDEDKVVENMVMSTEVKPDPDYATLTHEELKDAYTKDQLTAYLDRKGIEYPSKALKGDLIALIKGDDHA